MCVGGVVVSADGESREDRVILLLCHVWVCPTTDSTLSWAFLLLDTSQPSQQIADRKSVV